MGGAAIGADGLLGAACNACMQNAPPQKESCVNGEDNDGRVSPVNPAETVEERGRKRLLLWCGLGLVGR